MRKLRADEIECRIGMVRADKGITLLLYKDARCDMAILDEAFGPMNWQRHHSRDNANCTVAVRDKETGEWVEKEDVGTAGVTEPEKALASDSFKRACTNWGIGRELYTAPFIWIPANKVELTQYNGKTTTRDKFSVKNINYNEKNGDISELTIVNQKGVEVFSWRA